MDTISYKIWYDRTKDSTGKSIFNDLLIILEINDGISIVTSDLNPKGLQKKQLYKYFVNDNTQTSFTLKKAVKLHVPSSDNEITFRHDAAEKYIQIEFSVPKFWFSNNVCELVAFPKSPFYKQRQDFLSLSKMYIYFAKRTIFELISTISQGVFWLSERHYKDIEISRIDLCYNQTHDTLHDALTYLDALKAVKPKRLDAGRTLIYDTSLMFVTENYSFKIYHKGTEFEKKQVPDMIKTKKRMSKLYPSKKYTYLDRSLAYKEDLKRYADTILRYEFRFGKKMFTYLIQSLRFKENKKINHVTKMLHHVFENNKIPYIEVYNNISYAYTDIKGNVSFTQRFPTDKKTLVQKMSNGQYKIFSSIGTPTQQKNTYNAYKKVHDYIHALIREFEIKDMSDLKQIWNLYNSNRSKTIRLFLGPQKTIIQKRSLKQYFTSPHENDLDFAPEFLAICMLEFEKKFTEFQLTKVPLTADLLKEAERINNNLGSERNHKMNLNRIKIISHFLNNGHIDELKNRSLVSKATYYRMKADIKKLTGSPNFNFSPADSKCEKDLKNMFRSYIKVIPIKFPFMQKFIFNSWISYDKFVFK